MERVTGSRGLAVAALVSLTIHGVIAYAFVFKDAGKLKTYRPLTVALILPSELGKTAVPPPASAKEEKAPLSIEYQGHSQVLVDRIKDRKEAPPKRDAGIFSSLAAGEAAVAGASQAKDLEARDYAPPYRTEQNFRSSPEAEAVPALQGIDAYLPVTGTSTGKAMGSGANSPGSPKVAVSGDEMPLPGYAKLETSGVGALTLAAPRYNENPLPAYPLPARRRGYAGVVMLSVEVLVDGRVGRLEMKKTSGYDILDKSAWEAVKGWKFSPGKKMGTPVAMWVDLPVRFELNN